MLENPNDRSVLITSVDYVFNWARKVVHLARLIRLGLLARLR